MLQLCCICDLEVSLIIIFVSGIISSVAMSNFAT